MLKGWRKKFLQVRKPYVLITESEKDPVIRAIINTADIKVQFSEDQGRMTGMTNVFTLCTRTRGFFLQPAKKQDVEAWLYALDPLEAGSILSREGMKNATQKKP